LRPIEYQINQLLQLGASQPLKDKDQLELHLNIGSVPRSKHSVSVTRTNQLIPKYSIVCVSVRYDVWRRIFT